MTTTHDLIQYIETSLLTPVLTSPQASIGNRRRALTDRMRLRRLPLKSIALYIQHGAASGTPRRLAANERLVQEGFLSYRQLLARMRERFPDVWTV